MAKGDKYNGSNRTKDTSSLYFLSNSDSPGLVRVSHPLIEEITILGVGQ